MANPIAATRGTPNSLVSTGRPPRAAQSCAAHLATRLALAAVAALTLNGAAQAAGWEPTKTVEFIVPAGSGGGADDMARFISPLVEKYKLSPRPFIVVNKSAGAGAEGFLCVKAEEQDPHVVIISLEPLHDAARHRRAFQLEGPYPRGDAWPWISSTFG